MLTPEQLLEIADTLTCTGAIYRYRMRLDGQCRNLIELLGPVEDLGPVAKTIGGSLDARGQVLDMASPELAQVRQQLAELDQRVKNTINRLLRDPEIRKILRYPNATMNGDHYVLPVAVNHRHKLQGVVHRTSSTGETAFIEPAGVAHLSAERAVIKGDEDREVRRILRQLSSEVGRVAKPLTIAVDILARLDLITAKAKFSREYQMFAPDLNADGRLWLRQARHPLLEHLFREGTEFKTRGLTPPARQVVPIDVRLGVGFNLLVITGPNTGGKTVTLKTTGLLCLMAQSGMHIPAAEGHLRRSSATCSPISATSKAWSSRYRRLARTYRGSHPFCGLLVRTRWSCSTNSGAGTDPTEGEALGHAILDEWTGSVAGPW